MPDDKITSFEDVKRIVDEELVKNLAFYSEQDLRDSIRESFKDYQQKIVLEIVGITRRYGTWEVDHCNGRNSALSNISKGYSQSQIIKIIDDYIENNPIDIGGAIKEAIERELESNIRYSVYDHVKKHLGTLVQEYLNTAGQEHVKKYLDEVMKRPKE